MRKNIFAVLREGGQDTSFVFTFADAFHEATFSPDVEIVVCIPLEVKGKTYREKQDNLRQLAMDVQQADQGGLSWQEASILGAFFEDNARRYGLVHEFRENAII